MHRLMFNYLFYALLTVDSAQGALDKTGSSNIIGIGGIIATILVGIITSLVTWRVTLSSTKQKKLSYNIQIFPILSNSVTKSKDINLDDFKMYYKDKELLTPCLLAMEIANTGNDAITNPPIKIRSDENIEIIPGYFEDMPAGYEELWMFDKKEPNSCGISLNHINPNHIAKTRFFLDRIPQDKILFECPMENVQIQEIAYNSLNAPSKVDISSKSNLILIGITALIFITSPNFADILDYTFYYTRLRHHLASSELLLFIIATLVTAIVMNACGVPFIDNYIKMHPKQAKYIKIITACTSALLLFLIVFDFLIVGPVPQITTAVIVSIFLSLLIHFAFLSKNDFYNS